MLLHGLLGTCILSFHKNLYTILAHRVLSSLLYILPILALFLLQLFLYEPLPFSSIAGFGPIAAKSLYEAAKDGEEFMSIDEVRLAAKLGDSTVDLLREFGVFEGMQESNQISLFG